MQNSYVGTLTQKGQHCHEKEGSKEDTNGKSGRSLSPELLCVQLQVLKIVVLNLEELHTKEGSHY
jgi:hypothetical protein